MNAVTAAEMQALEQQAMEMTGVTTVELMDRAGYGVAEGVRRLAVSHGFDEARISIFAGRGNNGGDALVAARYLLQMEYDVEVLLAGRTTDLRGAALDALQKLKQAGLQPQALETVADWEHLLAAEWIGADITVDGLLGTGTRGPARGPAATAIQVINRFADRTLVVAIDIPSGLDADTGEVEGDAVMADLTLTMGLPKTGLLQPAALAYIGTVEVVDRGLPAAVRPRPGGDGRAELITPMDLTGWLPRRHRRAHKGNFGHALLIGGAPGFSGAISLAAMAACRSGAGLISVLTPADQVAVTAIQVPEAMVHGGGMTATGSLAASAVTDRFGAGLDPFSAVLIGPGLTTHPDGVGLLESVLRSAVPVVVLDADALTLVAAHPDLLRHERRGVILTPHPGEMARLAGIGTVAVEQKRHQTATVTAHRLGAVTVLKGAGTVVADGQRLAVNLSGNPGMATAGMGDALAGLMTGLAAQGLSPYAAACSAVYLHGAAGDEAARLRSQAGLTATMLIDAIPRTFRLIQAR